MAKNYYEILGVPENATADEIEAAFKKRAREVHPDTVSPDNAYLRQVAAEAFKDLSQAKATLVDRTEREKYDARLKYEREAEQRRSAHAAPPPPSAQSVPRSQGTPPAARAPQARRVRTAPRRPAPVLRPWSPTTAELAGLLFIVFGLGLVFFLVGMMWSGRNPPLWLAVITVALGLLSFRQGLKPATGTTIPGGRISLAVAAVLFLAILATVWILSEPNFAPETARLGIRDIGDITKPKTPQRADLQGTAQPKPNVVQVDPGGDTDAAGFVMKIWSNTADGKNYRTRLNGDLLYLDMVHAPGASADQDLSCEFHRMFAGARSWTGTCNERDTKDQSPRKAEAILSTFSATRLAGSTSDRPGFLMLPVDNVQTGQGGAPVAPQGAADAGQSDEAAKAERELATLHGTERELVESICLPAKIEVGQAEYDACVEKQLKEMKSAPPPPDLSGLSEHDRDAIQSECSNVRLMQGLASYNDCLKRELARMKE